MVAISMTIEQSDSLKAERDMHAALLARRDALQEALNNKLEELKSVCLQEGELTGDLPPEYPISRGEQPPLIRRRVGTTFSLSTKKVQDSDQISSELSKLELEVELQSKITSAAHRLASDKTVNKFVRKQRRQSYTKAVGKLKDMEKKLSDMRKQAGKVPAHSSSTSLSLSGSSSVTAAASVSPTATSKTFEGMYHSDDVLEPRLGLVAGEVDNVNNIMHDSDLSTAGTITAHQLHGNLPHRFQDRHRKKQHQQDDVDSIHSADSGVASGGGVVMSSRSSACSSLSPSPSLGSSLAGHQAASNTATIVSRRLASVTSSREDFRPLVLPEDSSSLDSIAADKSSPVLKWLAQPSQDDSFSASRPVRGKLPSSSSFADGVGRTKHFVVSRDPQGSRLKEMGRQPDLANSVSTINVASDSDDVEWSQARLARAEFDDDLDTSATTTTTCCGGGSVWLDDEDDDVTDESSRGCSFGDDLSLGGNGCGDSSALEEYNLWREEQMFSTRVQRRRRTVILSRSLRGKRENVIEQGCKAFENIFMGKAGPDNIVDSSDNAGRGRQEDRSRPPRRSQPELDRSELGQLSSGQKIQSIIDSSGDLGEARKPNRRSKSFDNTRSSRAKGNARTSKDDIKIDKHNSSRLVESRSACGTSAMYSKHRDRRPSRQQLKGFHSEGQVRNVRSGSCSDVLHDSRGYETNFGVIAGNIKVAGETIATQPPPSWSSSAQVRPVGRARMNHTVDTSWIHDGYSDSSSSNDDCSTPTSSGSETGLSNTLTSTSLQKDSYEHSVNKAQSFETAV